MHCCVTCFSRTLTLCPCPRFSKQGNQAGNRPFGVADQILRDGRAGRQIEHRAELASRTLAVIRLWPKLPWQSGEAAQCATLAMFCLGQGAVWSHPQLLIQAAQALRIPALKAMMCALSLHTPQPHSLFAMLPPIFHRPQLSSAWQV